MEFSDVELVLTGHELKFQSPRNLFEEFQQLLAVFFFWNDLRLTQELIIYLDFLIFLTFWEDLIIFVFLNKLVYLSFQPLNDLFCILLEAGQSFQDHLERIGKLYFFVDSFPQQRC